MTEQDAIELLRTNNEICNFQFFQRGFWEDLNPNGVYQKRWLWHDSDNLVWIDFNEAMAILEIMDIAPARVTDVTPIHKWLYLYSKKHTLFDFENLRDVLYYEIDRLVSYFIGEWFRYNSEGRNWGICIPDLHCPLPSTKYEDLDRFYQDHDFLRHYFSLDIWEEQIRNFKIPTTFKSNDSSNATHIYHDNAQHIDHSKNIHIDGSNIDMDKFLRDFLSDDVSMTQPVKKEKTQKVRKIKKPVVNVNFMTFKTNGITGGHVTLLYQKLMAIGWIPKDTPADDFQHLFSGKSCVCKITWTGGGKGNLRELFHIMREQDLITIPGNNGLETVLESHFVDKNGNYLTGLNSSGNGAKKSLPIINECIRILQQTIDFDE